VSLDSSSTELNAKQRLVSPQRRDASFGEEQEAEAETQLCPYLHDALHSITVYSKLCYEWTYVQYVIVGFSFDYVTMLFITERDGVSVIILTRVQVMIISNLSRGIGYRDYRF
jgi:hypothetical protein